MPNTTNKDYTKYSQKQLFNLMNKKEQEIEKLKRDRAYLEKKMAKELEKKDKGFTIKLEELNKILQEITKELMIVVLGMKPQTFKRNKP